MECCKTCGAKLELQAGAIVEIVEPPWMGLAVLLYKENSKLFWRMVLITGPHKGERPELIESDLRIVHGYVHIDRLLTDVRVGAGGERYYRY